LVCSFPRIQAENKGVRMDFLTLINNAKEALDAIAAHDDFIRLLDLELWDDPAITLSDARQALDDLQKVYESEMENVSGK
jgi:hypothetical protein